MLFAILINHYHCQTLCEDSTPLQRLANDLCKGIKDLDNLLLKATLIPGSKALLLSKGIGRPKCLDRACIIANSPVRQTQGIHTQ
jgi:hypothetical protein